MRTAIRRSLTATAMAAAAGLGAVTLPAAPAAAGEVIEPVPAATPARPTAWTSCVWTNAVRVQWSPVFSRSAPAVTSYEVRAYYLNGTQAASRTTFAWTTQADVNGLRSGTRYQFKVRAKNSAGWGAWSNGVYATTAR